MKLSIVTDEVSSDPETALEIIASWGVKWGATAAAMMLSVLPPLLLGLVSYRYLGRAMLAGAVKG